MLTSDESSIGGDAARAGLKVGGIGVPEFGETVPYFVDLASSGDIEVLESLVGVVLLGWPDLKLDVLVDGDSEITFELTTMVPILGGVPYVC